VDGRRRKVLFERDRYYLPDENVSCGRSEMEETCRSEPGRFSPNVVLRPVVQGAILPTLDYVAGPGEIAYWAQLRTVFERFGVPMPRVVPRPHVALVTRRCAKLIARHKTDVTDLLGSGGAPPIESAPELEAPSRGQVLVEASEQIMSKFERYVTEIAALDASLGKGAARLQSKIGYELGKLNEKARAAREERAAHVQGEIEELLAHLLPHGKPQERMLNIFPYLMESGWTLMSRLLQTVDTDRTGYQIVTT